MSAGDERDDDRRTRNEFLCVRRGGSLTEGDRAAVDDFRRFLRGEITAAELNARCGK